MARYARETRVNAPLETVWEFHLTPDGLEALTPDWIHLRVESVRGPDGQPDSEVLEEGTVIRLSMRPLGVGPRQSWKSRILRREEYPGAAYFRDEMMDGPFSKWVHTHQFYADEGRTRIRDVVEYQLPFGSTGRFTSPFLKPGFEWVFRHRHRRTETEIGSGESIETEIEV